MATPYCLPEGSAQRHSEQLQQESSVLESVLQAERRRFVDRARRKLSCRADAEDVVHDVFLSALARSDLQHMNRSELQGYISKAVDLRAIDLHRCRQRTRRLRKPVPGLDFETIPEQRGVCRLPRGALFRAVRRRTPRSRQILLLRYRRKCSYKQIGAMLGISPKTVANLLARARAALRDGTVLN